MLNNEICYLYGIRMHHFANQSLSLHMFSSILSLNLSLLLPGSCSILQLALVMLQHFGTEIMFAVLFFDAGY
jgi:hypothetical protein